MPYDQLLLPLLGGYMFVRHFNRTAYACSSYSGYKLIMSAALTGAIFILAAAVIIFLVGLSVDSDILHTIVIAPALVGLILLGFGTWKTAKAARGETISYETDFEGEYEQRESRRIRVRFISLAVFGTILLMSAIIVWHVFQTWGALELATTLSAAMIWIFVGTWAVGTVKSKSELHGHEVALRLGSIVVAAAVLFLLGAAYEYEVAIIWAQIVPFEYAGTAVLALLLALSSIWPFNLLYPYEIAIYRLYENKKLDGIESLFYYAGITVQQIMITMTDNKVYTGYVDGEIPIAGIADNYVTLIPLSSGYRDPQTRKLTITTEYTKPMELAILKKDIGLLPEDTAKVIPLNEIVTAGIFEPDLFEEFQGDSAKAPKRFGPRKGPSLVAK